jgi:F-type H+-transporting ATPase subunit delta
VIDRRITKRYAAALFKTAQNAEVIDLVESDLGLVSYTFESSPVLVEAVSSPLIPARKKKQVLGSIFDGKVHEVTLHYLYLLIDNRREQVIAETESEYIALANEARGIVSAEVTSAVELTDGEMTALRKQLSKLTGKKVTLNISIDESILGGLVVRIGDRVLDGSLKGHLGRIKDEFLGK